MSSANSQILSRSDVFASLGNPWAEDLLPEIQEALRERPNHKLIVLDDDPTGTQTVKNIPVVTDWAVETLSRELSGDAAGFFILTNSRSLPPEGTTVLHREVAANIREAAIQAGVTFTLISRSDSTLRGYYPLETDILNEDLGPFDLLLIAPYFEAGGRYTIDDVHYVAEGDELIPAAETPFAQDKAFGYKNSNLNNWVEEKTGGSISVADVRSISIDQLRKDGPAKVSEQLLELPKGSVCIVNSACPSDMEVMALATLQAERAGLKIAFRSAAAIVAARLGQRPREPLSPSELKSADSTRGGLIIVGSYVPKTTSQLESLLGSVEITQIELSVDDLLDASKNDEVIQLASGRMNAALASGRDVVVSTSRILVVGSDAESSLAIGRQVSDALVSITRQLQSAPSYLIAKGGITSSDVATLGLDVRRALIVGQALPGVPVWKLGGESRFAGMNYVVFPGNVGDAQALGQLVSNLQSVTK
ncbi:MAG: hypothetical protein ACI92G_001432 [Candidatus Pelagisphaera sp.]|jgi:uncharacterized protein YgbK (DUF1537 family)